MSDSTSGNETKIRANLEALLFVAPGPVAPSQFADALDLDVQVVEQELAAMAEDYAAERGIAIQWFAGKVQLTSAPASAPLVEKFLGLEATARLSRAGLETLAIVAYRQPITRPGVDAVRGVNSDGVMKSLLNKGMIQEIGRAETPGRPILYGVTNEFLQHFGLNSLADLPPYDVPEEGELIEEEHPMLKD